MTLVVGNRRSWVLAADDESAVGEARRLVRDLGRKLGLAEETTERGVLVVSEAVRNVVRYAGSGELLLSRDIDGRGLRMVVLDRGPGIPDLRKALRDGHSTGGTPGTGLGAIDRQSERFDIFSDEKGTIVFSVVRDEPAETVAFDVGWVATPKPGEEVSGDAWSAVCDESGIRTFVCDGLGHGLLASKASTRAVESFLREHEGSPSGVLERIDSAVRGTRGAAGSINALDANDGTLRSSGIGNVRTVVANWEEAREVISYNGTLGANPGRFREMEGVLPPEGALVIHTDGLRSRWDLNAYPGIIGKSAAVIAAALYRDWNRGTDDATVVVVKRAEGVR